MVVGVIGVCLVGVAPGVVERVDVDLGLAPGCECVLVRRPRFSWVWREVGGPACPNVAVWSVKKECCGRSARICDSCLERSFEDGRFFCLGCWRLTVLGLVRL